MHTPKQRPRRPSEYKYYAGFSSEFVQDVLRRYGGGQTRVLDPWNGSGTTSSVCALAGISCTGVDMNPATLPVAWGRLADGRHLRYALAVIESGGVTFGTPVDPASDNLLETYFSPESAFVIRSLRAELIAISARVATAEALSSNQAQALAGALFVLLSQFIHQALAPLRGSNPSWTKTPKDEQGRAVLSLASARNILDELVSRANLANSVDAQLGSPRTWPKLVLGDSRGVLHQLGGFDLVIASPPYCTRVDYGIATLPEILALGSMNKQDFQRFRQTLMGSVVTTLLDDTIVSRSPLADALLKLVASHPTKAANTYYYRYFRKYFNDLGRCLEQIGKVVQGRVVLVVQNSFFKDVHIDLVSIITEMMHQSDFVLESVSHYPRRQMAALNARSRRYRTVDVDAEAVLVFKN